MKIGAKIKIMAIGVAGVLVLGGAGVVVWHNQTTQEDLATNTNQTDQQVNKAPLTKDVSVKKPSPIKKPIEKPKEDTKDDETVVMATSQKEEIAQEAKVSEAKAVEAVDPEEEFLLQNFGLTRAEIKAKLPIMEEEIKTEILRIANTTNKILDVTQSGEKLSAEKEKWVRETLNDVQNTWLNLVDGKLNLYQQYKIRTGDIKGLIADTSEGGWIYEMQKMLHPDLIPVRVGTAGTGRD